MAIEIAFEHNVGAVVYVEQTDGSVVRAQIMRRTYASETADGRELASVAYIVAPLGNRGAEIKKPFHAQAGKVSATADEAFR